MLYRIDRLDSNGTRSYEYVCGNRALGKWCYEIVAHDDMEILNIVKLVWTWKAFKVCFSHTISIYSNMTTR